MHTSRRKNDRIRNLFITLAVLCLGAGAIACKNDGNGCGEACDRAFTECRSVFVDAGVPPDATESVCNTCCNDNADDQAVQALVECLNNDNNSCADCVPTALLLDFDEC